jgi:hypothetical protein
MGRMHIDLGTTEVKEYSRVGCKFAGRCPHVMEGCRQADRRRRIGGW